MPESLIYQLAREIADLERQASDLTDAALNNRLTEIETKTNLLAVARARTLAELTTKLQLLCSRLHEEQNANAPGDVITYLLAEGALKDVLALTHNEL
ncbi:MAG: hypothetical protein GVY13_05935 [Alphaproteobacteria bacterium]|jgi:hypothetical protein|nr:hypothetical protein [Alphaproteobacteria bacterium]